MEEQPLHAISNSWSLWNHLPTNDYSDEIWKNINTYQKIITISSIEEMLLITELLPESLLYKSMLFMMKDNIYPMWEDPLNNNGGGFSYQIQLKNIKLVWNYLIYLLVGNSMSNDEQFLKDICGLSISPKKGGFIILKIWMTNCNYKDKDPKKYILCNIKELNQHGCLFIKHPINKVYKKK
jgi:translation initiation factor 4E